MNDKTTKTIKKLIEVPAMIAIMSTLFVAVQMTRAYCYLDEMFKHEEEEEKE